jgi:hypothetical protein
MNIFRNYPYCDISVVFFDFMSRIDGLVIAFIILYKLL